MKTISRRTRPFRTSCNVYVKFKVTVHEQDR